MSKDHQMEHILLMGLDPWTTTVLLCWVVGEVE